METQIIFMGGCDLCFIESQIQELASCIPLRYDAGICKHKNEHTGVIEIMKVNQIGNLSERKRDNPSQNRVYDDNGLAPTLNCCGGGGLQPMVLIKQATNEGLIPCEVGGVVDLTFPSSKTRRGRVIDNGMTSPTLRAESIPSVLEDWTWTIDGETYIIRIRKLTPKECWRLMDFSDDDFDKAAQVNSNTQLYKQAGNSIVRNVLIAIMGQFIEGKEDAYKEIAHGTINNIL